MCKIIILLYSIAMGGILGKISEIKAKKNLYSLMALLFKQIYTFSLCKSQ